MFALASRLLLNWYRLSLKSCFYNEMTGNGYLDEDDRDRILGNKKEIFIFTQENYNMDLLGH